MANSKPKQEKGANGILVGKRLLPELPANTALWGHLPRAEAPAAIPVAVPEALPGPPEMAAPREASRRAAQLFGPPLTILQVAELIGCSPWTVRQTLIPRGLPHFRFRASGKLIFYTDQVIRWIETQQTRGGKTK
jgi:hypothetical protein